MNISLTIPSTTAQQQDTPQNSALASLDDKDVQWKEGVHFLYNVYTMLLPKEQEVARWSLVCKDWQKIIKTDTFRCIQFKLRNPASYQQVCSLQPLGYSWSSAYKAFIIQNTMQERLSCLNNRLTQLSCKQSEIHSQDKALEKLIEKTQHAVERRRKENLLACCFPCLVGGIALELYIGIKTMK